MNKFVRKILNGLVIVGIVLFSAFFIEQAFKFRKHIESITDTAPLVEEYEIIPERVASYSQTEQTILAYHNSRVATNSFWISIIAVFVTFLAFFVQYTFNAEQRKDIARERDLNQFFHLMDVYRSVTNSMRIPNITEGKDVCHFMFYEYKAMFKIASDFISQKHYIDIWTVKDINDLTFAFFINGITRNALPTFNTDIMTPEDKESLLIAFRDHLFSIRDDAKAQPIKYLNDYEGRSIKFFDGHRPRLVPYIKYINLILDWIIKHSKTANERKEYLSYLIAEMTDHEIGLLYCSLNTPNYSLYIKPYLKTVDQESLLLKGIFDSIPSTISFKFYYDKEDFLG